DADLCGCIRRKESLKKEPPMYEVSRRQAMFTLGALAFVVAGCGSEDAPPSTEELAEKLADKRVGAMDNFTVGTQFKATQELTFDILYNNHSFYPIKKNWLFWSELTKRTNVKLNPEVVPLSDYENKPSPTTAAGGAPPTPPTASPGQAGPFASSAAIRPRSGYLDLMPHLQDKIRKWTLHADIDTLRQADGRFYLLPGVHENIWIDYSP